MPRLHSFGAARWLRTINLVLQGILFLTLIGGLNYLALHRSWRFDLTEHRRYSLSPETLSYLTALEQPVKLVVTIEKNSEDPVIAQAFRDISALLREYTSATEGKEQGQISVEYIDVYQRRREAEQLGIDRADIVLAICGNRRRVITLDEFYVVRDGNRKEAFAGEQAVTAAVLEVSNPDRPRVYFVTGHGEMSPDDVDPRRGLSVLAEELRLRNFEIGLVNLAQARRVPEDASLVVIAAPAQGRYQPYEVELLRQYASARAGRLIILVPPAISHGLDDLLLDWGIVAEDVWVYDTDQANVTETGDLNVTYFPEHPITQVLNDYKIPLTFGPTRVVRPDPARPLDASLRVTVLAATAPSAWGERDYRLRGRQEFNPSGDLRGHPELDPSDRLSLAVASERVTPPKNLPFSVRGGRLVVFGNGDFASNDRISLSGNRAVLLSAVDWCVDREVQLNTPPRPIERYQLNLSQQQVIRLRYSLLLILPGIAALLGLLVYWTRRT